MCIYLILNPFVINHDAASPAIVRDREVIERRVLSSGHARPAAAAAAPAGALEGGRGGSWGEEGEGGAEGEEDGDLEECECIDWE